METIAGVVEGAISGVAEGTESVTTEVTVLGAGVTVSETEVTDLGVELTVSGAGVAAVAFSRIHLSVDPQKAKANFTIQSLRLIWGAAVLCCLDFR